MLPFLLSVTPRVLTIAFAFLTVTVALGMRLAALVMGAGRHSGRLAAVHGALGALGLVLLVLSLLGATRGVAQGAGLFGWDAAVLLAAAALSGLGVLLRRGGSGGLLFLHASIAVFGYVILASYITF